VSPLGPPGMPGNKHTTIDTIATACIMMVNNSARSRNFAATGWSVPVDMIRNRVEVVLVGWAKRAKLAPAHHSSPKRWAGASFARLAHPTKPLRGRPAQPRISEMSAAADAMVFERELVVLAQRVAGPIFGQQNPRQVGMAGEPDAAQVVDFALVPVRGGPDAA